MRHHFLSIAAIVFAFAASPIHAEAKPQLAWGQLVDASAQAFDDPYRDLTNEQLNDLISFVRLSERLDSSEVTEEARAGLEAQVVQQRDALKDMGIDVDWLISQRWVVAERREKAAAAGNPDVDGQTVILAGFAIPAPPEADGTPVAYLVPERGMCSHMPPPDANQMIRARLKVHWKPSGIHEPVRVTGKLSIDPTSQAFRIVDGPVQMNATFQMDVEKLETLQGRQFGKIPAVPKHVAERMAERRRTTGAATNTKGVASQ